MRTPFVQHLLERGLTEDISHWIDYVCEIVTFPLFGVDKAYRGYQRYAWDQPKIRSNLGRYYTWISPEYRPLAFWGMEYVSPYLARCAGREVASDSPLIIVEGIFDALRVIQCGFRACAILTATPSPLFVGWFNQLTLRQRKIAIKDNDGQKSGLDKLAQYAIMSEWHKDLGDHTVEEADEWLRETLSELDVR